MTYATIKDLPVKIQNTLPEHAQELFFVAYNCAHEEHRLDHEKAVLFAWEAVKKHYEEKNGTWIEKQLSH